MKSIVQDKEPCLAACRGRPPTERDTLGHRSVTVIAAEVVGIEAARPIPILTPGF